MQDFLCAPYSPDDIKRLYFNIDGMTPFKLAWGCSVMQSDGNSFDGDVVSDIFNKTFRDEDNNLDQMYKSKYAWISWWKGTIVALKPNFMRFLLLCAAFL